MGNISDFPVHQSLCDKTGDLTLFRRQSLKTVTDSGTGHGFAGYRGGAGQCCLQRLCGHRFLQKIHRTEFHLFNRHRQVAVAGQEYHRQRAVPLLKDLMHTAAVKMRHAHIQ